MSFRNTHTPTRSEIKGNSRYQCPMHKVRGIDAYYLTPELKAHFIRLYPVTMNRDMMRMFGISFSTVQRFKRSLGLEKKMRTIRRKHAKMIKRICEKSGYYDSIRGIAPSEACKEASKKLRETGWNPLKGMRHKNNRKYHRLMQARSEKRKELIRKERLRIDWGLEAKTKIIPYDPYGGRRTSFRNTAKKVGYIPGNAHIPAERWTIYFNESTRRGARREQNGIALGFKFEQVKPL